MRLFLFIVSLVVALSCTVVREGPFVTCIEQHPVKDSATVYLPVTYFRYHDHAWDLNDQGVLPHNTGAENSRAIARFLATFEKGTAPLLRLPAGDYRFDTTITIPEGLAPHLVGDNGTAFARSTRILVDKGDGIHVSGGCGGTTLEHLYVIGNGGGRGFYLQSQVQALFCSARNFDFGFYTWANISSEGTNASSSLFLSCHALENLQDGFIAGIEDANVIAYINCDARDNGRYGFNDYSFLGNNYLSCMTHNNKEGGYFVRDLYNSRSTFMGCYSEEGQKPAQLRPRSVIAGGLWGSGYRINDGPVIYK